MTLIAAADREWGIGRAGGLLWRIPADLRRFQALTMGHALLMGRKTFGSLPGLLPGRAHAVLSRACGEQAASLYSFPDITVLHNREEALAWAQGKQVFLIGGGEIFHEMLGDCERAYITRIDAAGGADTFMPNLDELPEWRLAEAGAWREAAGLRWRFCEYGRARGGA